MIAASLFLFYFLTPLLILYLCHKSNTLKKVGAIIIAYLTGVLFGNIGIIPRGSDAFRNLLTGRSYIPDTEALELFQLGVIRQSDMTLNQIASTQDLIMTIAIPLAIPLLLFSLDLKNSFRILKKGFFSTIIAILSLISCVVLGYFLFKNTIPEAWKVSGMMMGLYTGGTPNLAALATALEVKPNIFLLTQTYDLIIGVLLLLFFITIAQRLFNYILPHFNGNEKHLSTKEIIRESEVPENLIENFRRKMVLPLAGALGISALIFAIGGGISMLLPHDYQMATVILSITALGILFGLIPKINKIEKTFELGMYFILVFSIAVSSMADFRTIFQIEFLDLFFYVIIAVFGSMLVHVILSVIFKIDTDTTIVTITALSMSPPFVPIVAGALKNKEIILTGITVGVFGYAIGNFLGIFFAYLLRNL
jgi:uncharacterized membrane protein